MLRPGEQAFLRFHDGIAVHGHVEWLQSDRFVVRAPACPPGTLAQDASFSLSLREGRCDGRGRLARLAPAASGGQLLTVTVQRLDRGETVYRASLRRQLADPQAVRDEAEQRLHGAAPHRPQVTHHAWQEEERFRF